MSKPFPHSLRRRFKQNKDDTLYTLMALMPTLGEQILQDMDVEAVIHELQSTSKRVPHIRPHPQPERTLPLAIQSTRPLDSDHDAPSEAGSLSSISASGRGYGDGHGSGVESVGESALSWVDQFSAPSTSASPLSQAQPLRSSTDMSSHPLPNVDSPGPSHLSDSIMTTNSSALSFRDAVVPVVRPLFTLRGHLELRCIIISKAPRVRVPLRTLNRCLPRAHPRGVKQNCGGR
jgi:peroxin-3